MTSEVIKLNIGCGKYRKPGYLGVDIIPSQAVDILGSANSIPSLKDETIDEIIAEHVIEHMLHKQVILAIKEWFRLLKPGGRIEIECPDLLALCQQFIEANEYKRYVSSSDYWALIYQLFGHQNGSNQEEQYSQIHKTGFTEEHLRLLLENNGFENIEKIPFIKGPPDTAVLRLRATKCKK